MYQGILGRMLVAAIGKDLARKICGLEPLEHLKVADSEYRPEVRKFVEVQSL